MCAQKFPDDWMELKEQNEEYESLWLKVRETLKVHETAIIELESFVDKMKILNVRVKKMLPPEGDNTK